jgi:misacylated tRNA(Ala) deacylase|tara:strand:+ start:298 stop:1005 length:708 start_codon:yes stop_codon:yes gene_type:complete
MNKKITSEIFRDDPYKKECEAKILDFGDNWIILDQTVFYAEGGGQLGDTGLIKAGQQEIQIENTIKENDLIKHIFNSKFDFEIGDNVTCIIDWDRRYKLMKMHTSLHLLCSLVNAKVTGGSVGDGKGRLDFNLDFKPNKEELKDNLNDLIQGNHDITISWISAQELDKNPNLVKTMSVLPPRTNGSIRMVRIGDNIDYQPCGGTHVKNTSEIGLVEINKVENKGKLNKRVAISLV